MEANLKPQKQMMYMAKVTPADCYRHAQVVILNENGSWVIAPAPYGAYVVNEQVLHFPVPVVDVRQVREEDDERLKAVLRDCVDDEAGVMDMAGLLRGLEALGATIVSCSQRVASRGRGDRMRVN
jgi:hypothetical protein